VRCIITRIENITEEFHSDIENVRVLSTRHGLVGFIKSVLFGTSYEDNKEKDMPLHTPRKKQHEHKKTLLKIKDEIS
jgi:hypothetical protein